MGRTEGVRLRFGGSKVRTGCLTCKYVTNFDKFMDGMALVL